MKIIKTKSRGSEGWITSYTFWLLGRKWIVAISESKWHKGDKFTKMPVWFSVIDGNIPSIFIWNIAIGFQRK